MSGGSWDYLCYKVEEAAMRLKGKDQTALRRAFGKHLLKCAKALHDIEWNDSGDGAGEPGEEEDIRACLANPKKEELGELIDEGTELVYKLSSLIADADKG